MHSDDHNAPPSYPTQEQEQQHQEPHVDSPQATHTSQTHTSQTHTSQTDAVAQEVAIARRCFNNLDRLMLQISSYPPGHPAIENAIHNTYNTFREYFQFTDRLSVAVHPHSFNLFGTDEEIWATEEPKDYCFILSRDGIFLIHFLAGIDHHTIKRFAEVLNHLLDQRHNNLIDSASAFFEANLLYISYDALDESLASLAGIDLDMRSRDTREEKEIIEDLFNKAFEQQDTLEQDHETVDGDYEINVQNPAERMRKIEIGSREFLNLDPQVQQQLNELKLGFTQHKELEHRQGEILSAILGAGPKAMLRAQAIEQIGKVMAELLHTPHPWEALTFLKIIHQWRDKFDSSVSQNLKDVVASSFDNKRLLELVRQVTRSETKERRMILQMFNALHLEEASANLVRVIAWNLDDETRHDILLYLEKRTQHGFGFFEKTIHEIPAEHSQPIIDILKKSMPRSRHVLLNILKLELEPALKAQVLRALQGSWNNADEMRKLIGPFIKAQNSDLRLEACRTFCDVLPQQVVFVMEPLFSQDLRKRPDEEIRELAQLFVTHGGAPAVAKLRVLIQRRGLTTTEQERELAVSVARALMRTPHPAVISMLDEVAKDWRVPGRIRNTCKEIADILKVGR